MSNTIYPKAKEALGKKLVDLTADDIRAVLVKSTGSYNAAHDFLDDLGANTIGTAQAISGSTMSGRDLSTSAGSVTFSAVTTGSTVSAVVLYVHTGTGSTSRLIAWIDTQDDTTPINVATDGTDIRVTLPSPLIRL